MPSLVTSAITWLRHHRPWPVSRQGWQEAIGLGLLLAAAGVAGSVAGSLPPVAQLFVWVLLLATLAILARRGWFTLFGPVLPYDLVRNSRRNRYLLYRLYAYFILILVAMFLVAWIIRRREQQLV